MRLKASFVVLWNSLVALTVLMTGCIVIPVDYHASGSRKNINPDTAETIVVGTTTRREIMLQLGEPEYYSEDGNHIGYAWVKVRALMAIGAYYSADIVEITNDQVLELHFDEAGVVTLVEVNSSWGGPVDIGVESSHASTPPQSAFKDLVIPFELIGILEDPAEGVQVKVIDQRKGMARVSTRTAAFGASMVTISYEPDEVSLIERTIAHALAEAGREEAAWIANLKAFRVYTDAGVLSWNIICTIEVELMHAHNNYRLTTTQEKRTYIWPSADLVHGVVMASLEKIQNQTTEVMLPARD